MRLGRGSTTVSLGVGSGSTGEGFDTCSPLVEVDNKLGITETVDVPSTGEVVVFVGGLVVGLTFGFLGTVPAAFLVTGRADLASEEIIRD